MRNDTKCENHNKETTRVQLLQKHHRTGGRILCSEVTHVTY